MTISHLRVPSVFEEKADTDFNVFSTAILANLLLWEGTKQHMSFQVIGFQLVEAPNGCGTQFMQASRWAGAHER